MKETMFLPPANLRPRIAPTEQQPDGEILRGVVHDPTARFMGGVAGDAGLFSTADDLARFCQMMLNRGNARRSPRLQPAHRRLLHLAAISPVNLTIRGLGWDIDSRYSGNRGELFPKGRSYGHTGFTGTSIWIDPVSQTYRDPAGQFGASRNCAPRSRRFEAGWRPLSRRNWAMKAPARSARTHRARRDG